MASLKTMIKSRRSPALRHVYKEALSGFTEEDIDFTKHIVVSMQVYIKDENRRSCPENDRFIIRHPGRWNDDRVNSDFYKAALETYIVEFSKLGGFDCYVQNRITLKFDNRLYQILDDVVYELSEGTEQYFKFTENNWPQCLAFGVSVNNVHRHRSRLDASLLACKGSVYVEERIVGYKRENGNFRINFIKKEKKGRPHNDYDNDNFNIEIESENNGKLGEVLIGGAEGTLNYLTEMIELFGMLKSMEGYGRINFL